MNPAPPDIPVFLVELRNAVVLRAGHTALTVERFTLRPGQHWAVLGGNGAGKSTLLKLLRGELWPLHAQQQPPPRRYGFAAPPATAPLGCKERMPLVAAELQLHYRRQGWRITGLEAVAAGMFDASLLYRALSPEQEERARHCLERLHAGHLAQRLLPSLSQGELRRVLVARALAACRHTPAVLLLDEVCDGLDPEARRLLLLGLEDIIRHESGIQLVCSSHRMEELPRGLSHLALCHEGHLRFQTALEGRPVAEALPSSAALPPDVLEATAPPAVPPAVETLLAHYTPARPAGEPLLDVAGVDVYRDGTPVLHAISWRMRQGEHWALTGGNGAGKSTLLALLCGELHPACVRGPAGAVLRHFDHPNLAGLRRSIGLVAPHLEAAWDYEATALELVASGLDARIGLHGLRHTSQQFALAMSWLEAFGLERLAQRPFGHLSSGQRRRCFLARALLAGDGQGPALLALDEPCAGLDAASRKQLLQLLGRLARAGVPLLVASHHPEELPPEISHVCHLAAGRIIAQGPREQILAGLPGDSA